MRRLKIAVDVDDVLAEHAAGFVEFSNQRWGTKLTVEDYNDHWAEMWAIDNNQTEARADEYHRSTTIRHYNPVVGADEALRRLAQPHELHIVTSRRRIVHQDTVDWLDEHYGGIFHIDAINFAGLWDDGDTSSTIRNARTKADLVVQIDADVLIDDQLKHCLAVAERGRYALLFGHYSWNQSDELPDRVVRCLNWIDVEREIARIAEADLA